MKYLMYALILVVGILLYTIEHLKAAKRFNVLKNQVNQFEAGTIYVYTRTNKQGAKLIKYNGEEIGNVTDESPLIFTPISNGYISINRFKIDLGELDLKSPLIIGIVSRKDKFYLVKDVANMKKVSK